jgi:hypothetical protein
MVDAKTIRIKYIFDFMVEIFKRFFKVLCVGHGCFCKNKSMDMNSQ